MNNGAGRARDVRGFTLVELLVVLAMIAVLAAFLLPSVARAREQAKSVKCLANLKEQLRAGVAYSQEDRGEKLIPLHPRYLSAKTGDAPQFGPRSYLVAARLAYGGKSGRHDYDGERYSLGPVDPTAVEVGADPHTAHVRYSTGNGMGPATRPLNRYLYKEQLQNREGADLNDMRRDELLELNIFRCPSDAGYESWRDGGGPNHHGIFVGMGEWHSQPVSFYESLGSSYGADSVLDPASETTMLGYGPWMRPLSQIPNPSEMTLLKEIKGFKAAYWNPHAENFVINPGDWGNEDLYTWGNHGRLRRHNVGFCDGHARPILYEVSDDVVATVAGYVATGQSDLRGGRVDQVEPNGSHPDGTPLGIGGLYGIGMRVKRGEGWRNNCFPSPPVLFSWAEEP